MTWLSKIFSKKVYDDVRLEGKFKDAVETSPLVISDALTKPYDSQAELEISLQNLTKSKLVEHAVEEYGLDLDRRLTKQQMIEKILEEKL